MKQFKSPKCIPLVFHQYHDVEIRPSDKLRGQGFYWCLHCEKWIAWLSKKESQAAREIGLLK